MTAPRKKAPKTAWMPMRSVTKAEVSSAMHTTAVTPCVICVCRSTRRRSNGRATVNIAAM